MVTDRPTTTYRRGRAWVPAVVSAGLVAVLLFAAALVREFLDDRDIGSSGDLESHVSMFVRGPMSQLPVPGVFSDVPSRWGDLGITLGVTTLAVLVITWLISLAARDLAGAVTVLVGAWLATILGTAIGGLTRTQLLILDFEGRSSQAAQMRYSGFVGGLYWGTVVGLLVGLVAMLAWLATRRRVDVEPVPAPSYPPGPERSVDESATPAPDGPVTDASGPDPAYPPPTGEPAGTPPAPGPTGTVRAPEQRAAQGLGEDEPGPGQGPAR